MGDNFIAKFAKKKRETFLDSIDPLCVCLACALTFYASSRGCRIKTSFYRVTTFDNISDLAIFWKLMRRSNEYKIGAWMFRHQPYVSFLSTLFMTFLFKIQRTHFPCNLSFMQIWCLFCVPMFFVICIHEFFSSSLPQTVCWCRGEQKKVWRDTRGCLRLIIIMLNCIRYNQILTEIRGMETYRIPSRYWRKCFSKSILFQFR